MDFGGEAGFRDAAGRLELEELVRLVLLGLESSGSSHGTSWPAISSLSSVVSWGLQTLTFFPWLPFFCLDLGFCF